MLVRIMQISDENSSIPTHVHEFTDNLMAQYLSIPVQMLTLSNIDNYHDCCKTYLCMLINLAGNG